GRVRFGEDGAGVEAAGPTGSVVCAWRCAVGVRRVASSVAVPRYRGCRVRMSTAGEWAVGKRVGARFAAFWSCQSL
ncbi:hypothetical protein, partial [Gordonibacter sp. An230]|uniref:hypothetical protein n=1 Tax=Gordonibacter sp. An230 TaxID=1965592 RepID=UPI00195036F8